MLRRLLLVSAVALAAAACADVATAGNASGTAAAADHEGAPTAPTLARRSGKVATVERIVDAEAGDDVIVPSCEVLVLRQECVLDHCVAILKRHC